MNECRNEFVKGYENEATVVHSRVWKRQKFGFDSRVFADQQVEIDRARTHANLASAAETVFDSQQARHELFGRGKRRTAKFGDHVQKRRLVLVLYGLGFVDVRKTDDVEARVEHAADGEQKAAGPVAEV